MADYAKLLRSLAKEANVNIPKDAFRTRRSKFSIEGTNRCPKCNKGRTTTGWCKPCDNKTLEEQFGTWTSGNEELDKFIQETQSNANTPFDFMRWIEYDMFTNIEFIAKGGFGSVFSADTNSQDYGKVALKFLDNSETLTKEFLDELRAHHRCSLGSGIIDCYGVSKDPKTNKYVMVLRYADHGNLRMYLGQYFGDLSWAEKIVLFEKVAKGLQAIHDAGLVHRDFHCGNILRHEKLVYVTDLGMCRPVSESADTDIYGVLPYVAPEVLRGAPYTEKADIYSLGMIMWELSSNQPPFADRAHDYSLAVDICNGLRPPIIAGTPKSYMAAMLRCWDSDPLRRPQASELLEATIKWRLLPDGTAPFQGPKRRNVKTIPVKSPTTPTNVHPQAFYTSRLLHYPKLPEPRNSDTFMFFDPDTGETHRMLRKQPSRGDASRPNDGQRNRQAEKGKNRQMDQRTHIRSRDISRSMSMDKVDKEILDRLRRERRRSSSEKVSTLHHDLPKRLEDLNLNNH